MNPDESHLSLGDAIDHLSSKRSVISDEAIHAKTAIEEDKLSVVKPKAFKKQTMIIQEFNESVQLLGAIFEKSGFDRMALYLSHTQKVLFINFCVGIVWGLGFCLAILIFLASVLYFFHATFPHQTLTDILRILLSQS